MSWRQFLFSPEGFDQTALLLSAGGSGSATGVLAMGSLSAAQAAESLKRLARTGFGFGVSLPGLRQEAARLLLADFAGRGLSTVVLTDPSCEGLADSVTWCLNSGLEPLVEVTTLGGALRAVECGAAGLIAKGSESGGSIGEETTFILLQKILPRVRIPIYARGGIGLHTASACLAAGAAGVALDWQLALAEESTLPEAVKARIARMDGSETAVLGQESKVRFRAYSRVGETAYFDLKKFEEAEGIDGSASDEALLTWTNRVNDRVRSQELLLVGQDAAFAQGLAHEFRNVKGICQAIHAEAMRQVRVASRLNHLGENGPLAKAEGTRFPLHQGPMTRVSDNADFALAVAQGGAIPYLALALMRGPEVARLLQETSTKLGSLPWGVGILGFVPKELRDEQMAEVRKVRPPFMVIAGGRPDMAKQFEGEGIHVYLHVPSPALAKSFLESGARRLIFEGRECGGHVGPRTSFVLWEQMTRMLLEHLRAPGAGKAEDYHIIFAGGIHDARSGAMLAAITAPLAERGVRIGALAGTGYLFTREIVATGAITTEFQEEALACRETVLVESGVGHATRCADSQFATAFADLKRRLTREGKPKEEIREELEKLNLGRLRIASKGTVRAAQSNGRAVYHQADADTIRREGMFMIGQVATLRCETSTVEQLHEDICAGGTLLAERTEAMLSEYREGAPASDADIAIVGLSCLFPESTDVREYWQNILNRRYSVREIPKERFDSDVYFNSDRRAPDKIYSRWGGFLDDVMIDPMKFGMPPSSLSSIDPMQLVTLEVVHRALRDAGYGERRFDRENTCCIVGTGGGVGELGLGYGIRSMLPYYVDQAGGTLADSAALIEQMDKELPSWTEDSFAGLLLNVVAGRVANRFDFGGTNFIVDAACATGLAALRHAVTELETRSSNVAVVAACDMMQSPFTYLSFSKTQALSPTGQPRVFDETADGIVISEGVACAVLKRLDDALRDGDKIYGLVKSVGASSDGKDKGLTAPRAIGQMRALERAYKKSGVAPETVGLMEAHGTGTAVGDRTESEALAQFFQSKGADHQSVALGSVKSMIGHAKCAAGFAGFFKAVMAMRHQVLPSTLGVTKPNSKIDLKQSPLYINTETRPWLQKSGGAPRRAGISAFGFGGTNYHVVAEEFRPIDGAGPEESPFRDWPSELFLWKKNSAEDLSTALGGLAGALEKGSRPALVDLASAVCWEHGRGAGPFCLAVVAQSVEDLLAKLQAFRATLDATKEHRELKDPKGVYFSPRMESAAGKIAFAFPGQGSQSVGMMNDLAVTFAPVRSALEEADATLGAQLGKPLSAFIFPPPVFADSDKETNDQALKRTDVAQPALGAADLGMFRLLASFGIHPDSACGHSYGEFAALCAAGTFSLPELIRISELRGRVIVESAQNELGTMAAVEGGEARIAPILKDVAGVVIANLNGPSQTVISGTKQGIEEAVRLLKDQGLKARPIPVACAFHSPLVSGARAPLHDGLAACDLNPPRFPVYSNTVVTPHTGDAAATCELLTEHLVQPVRFNEEIEAMYAAGARVFIECGPGRVLTGLISSCLEGRSHIAINMDQPARPGLVHLTHALAQLAVSGVSFYATRLFEGRVTKNLALDKLLTESLPQPAPATAWVVSNGRAVPSARFHDPSWTPLPPFPERRASGEHVLLRSAEVVFEPAVQHSISPSMSVPVSENPISVYPNAIPPAAAMPIPANQMETVMQGHHRLMNRFLETHRTIMMACLQPGVAMASTAAVPVAYGRPAETMDRPMAAPVVVMPAPAVRAPEPVPAPKAAAAAASAGGWSPAPVPAPVAAVVPASAVAAPPAAARITREAITKALVELVSQRTGYPADSLDLDLDLEGELGVDSIKRVEILGALQSESILPGQALDGHIEALSKLKTLRAIVEFVYDVAGQSEAAAVPIPVAAAVAIPAAAPPPPLPLPAATPARVTREAVTKTLVELVSVRTGYPVDSLDLDLDLEGELGVDSIKRVEILSALQTESILPEQALDGHIEALSKLKTLRAIVDFVYSAAVPSAAGGEAKPGLSAASQPVSPSVPQAAPATAPPVVERPAAAVTRLTVEVVDAPLPRSSTPCSVFLLVTDDQSGAAAAFCARLTELGVAHARIAHSPDSGADLQNEASVAALVSGLRQKHGPIGGLVHLMPVAPVATPAHPAALAGMEARTLLDLRSLYLLTRELEKDLRSAKSGILLSATRIGGGFGFGSATPGCFLPG